MGCRFSLILRQNIVHALAILLPERMEKYIMDNRHLIFCGVIAQARIMLQKGLITADEFARVDHVLSQKYKILPGSIFRDIRLINPVVRGNMRH